MAVSNDTANKVYEVLKKHLTGRQIRLILDDLTQVPGNQSFRETISRLIYIHSIKASGEILKEKEPEE
jgi:hypothetical protein